MNKFKKTKKSHNEIVSHTCQNSYYQKDKKQQALMKMWRKGNPRALLIGM